MSRTVALVLWFVLVAVAFGGSPPARPDQTEWLLGLLVGRWGDENPLVVVEFWLMGIWPALMALLLRDHLRNRPMPAWPFLLGSLALGCFVLIPWFWSRRGLAPTGPPGPAFLGAPAIPAALGVAAAAMMAWAAFAGDPAAFVHTFRTDGFVWPMTFDFLAFTALFAIEARARAAESRTPWPVVLVPVLGAAAWLAGRRPTNA